jgi:peptide/nickel transport system permease protein
MKRFLWWRLIKIIPLVLAVSVITFAFLHLAPGGPVGVISGNPKVSGEDINRIAENYALDKPLPVQYLYWFKRVFLNFDFGRSYVTGRPVMDMIKSRIPATVELMGTAFVIALLLGISMGVLSALNRNHFLDHLFSVVSSVGLSMPVFWLGLMAMALFSVRLGILPAGGTGSVQQSFSLAGHIRHLILPALVLSFSFLASWSRYMRSGLLEAMDNDYITTARAKGLDSRTVIFKHALKNAILPLSTVVVLRIPALFTGAVITETVFSWPGMGRLFYEGIRRNDYTRVLGIVVISCLLIIIFNLIGDIICFVIDPRTSAKVTEGSGGGISDRRGYEKAV